MQWKRFYREFQIWFQQDKEGERERTRAIWCEIHCTRLKNAMEKSSKWVMTSIDENVFCFDFEFSIELIVLNSLFSHSCFAHSLCLYTPDKIPSTWILHAIHLYKFICVRFTTDFFCMLFVCSVDSHVYHRAQVYVYNIWLLKRKQQTELCYFVFLFFVFLFHLTPSMSTIGDTINKEPNESFAFLSLLENPSCFDGNTFNSNASTEFNRLLYNCSVKWKIRARYIARWNTCTNAIDKKTNSHTHTHKRERMKQKQHGRYGMGEYGLWTSMNQSHSHK